MKKFEKPTEVTDLDLDAQEKVVEAAAKWWLNKRPIDMTTDEHIDNPIVNCSGWHECNLAIAVAWWMATS